MGVIIASIAILGLTSPVSAVFGSSCSEDWPTYRGDYQRTGACGNVSGPGSGEILWSLTTRGLNIPGSPAVVGDTVYFSADQFVYGVDRYNGSVRWTYETGGGIGSSPAIVNGTLYIGSSDGYVYALDTTEGELEWRRKVGKRAGMSPTVFAGHIYAGPGGPRILALNASSGDPIWETKLKETAIGNPVVSAGRVFFGDREETFYALHASNGTEIWTRRIEGGVDVGAAIQGQGLFIGTNDGDVYSANSGDGKIARVNATTDFESMVSVSGTTDLFVSGGTFQNGKRSIVLRLERSTSGDTWGTAWKNHIDEALNGPVTIGNNTVYISGSSGDVWALDKSTGDTVWKAETAPVSRSPPTVADGVIYVGSDSSRLFAIDAGAGSKLENITEEPSGSGEAGPEKGPRDSVASPGILPVLTLVVLTGLFYKDPS